MGLHFSEQNHFSTLARRVAIDRVQNWYHSGPQHGFAQDTSTYDKVPGTRTLQRKGVNPPLCPAYFVRPRGDSRGAGNRSAKAAG